MFNGCPQANIERTLVEWTLSGYSPASSLIEHIISISTMAGDRTARPCHLCAQLTHSSRTEVTLAGHTVRADATDWTSNSLPSNGRLREALNHEMSLEVVIAL
jgi:hypothetical protein